MFRYVGLAWDSAVAEHAGAAQRLSLAFRSRPQWRPELVRPGLHVYTAGARQGANGAYLLPAERGVVLGKLFRRSDFDHPTSPDLDLKPTEADKIQQTGGRALIEDFWGRYVAFLLDEAGAIGVLRDPSGALPCFRMHHEGVSIVFSWLEDVLDILPWVPIPKVNWTSLAAHILFVKLGGHETALEGVQQVLPGEAVPLAPDTAPPVLLWNAAKVAREPMDIDRGKAAELLRRTVRSCARSWANCHDSILLRLSGGVDSSILLSCLDPDGTLAQVTCLNYHSPGADSDERQYARLAAQRARRPLLERERATHVRLDRMLDVARTPGPSNYVGRLGAAGMDAVFASELGASALFTGAGGDQLFFELRCCWPAADYLHVRRLDTGFWAAAMDAARLGRVSVWKSLRQAIADRVRPADPWQDAGRYLSLINADALPRPGERERFVHPALLPGHGLPVGKLNQTLQLLHPVDYYDPYDREAAPEAVDPLLSQPLIELCLRLPTYVLTHGGRGRALARQAFAADLPTEIANRRSKGGLEEHVQLVLQRNLDFARSLLLDGELVRRGILDRRRLEEALSGRHTTLAAHAFEIHVYIGIEAWLQRWPERHVTVARPQPPAE